MMAGRGADVGRCGYDRSPMIRGEGPIRGLSWWRLCVLTLALFAPLARPMDEPAPGHEGEDPLTPELRAWVQANPRVRMYVSSDYQPLDYLDARGIHRGLAADMARLVSERVGIELIPVARPPGVGWDPGAPESRDVDGLMLSVKTESRRERWCFTEPYLSLPVQILVRSNGPLPKGAGLRDLEGLRVAVVADYAARERLESLAVGATVVPVEDTMDGLQRLSFGGVDAFVTDLAAASYVVQRLGLTNLMVAGQTEIIYEMGFCVRKDRRELRDILQVGLSLLTPSERAAIYDKWINLRGLTTGSPDAFVILGSSVYNPVEFTLGGAPSGLMTEVYDLLGRTMGTPIELRFMDPATAGESFAGGAGDALSAVGQLTQTDERFLYSQPLFPFEYAVFRRRGEAPIGDLRELEGMRLGRLASEPVASVLEGVHSGEVVVARSYLEAFRLLQDGTIDALIADKWVGQYTIREHQLGLEADPIAVLGGHEARIAVRVGEERVLARINRAISLMKNAGQLQKLLERWRPYPLFQHDPPPQYDVSHWDADSGLPQNSVNRILQTSDGYIWMTTFGGIARFDGVRFKVFNTENTPELRSNRWVGLYEDAQGVLWLGSADHEVYRYDNGVFTRLDSAGALNRPLGDFAPLPDGALLLESVPPVVMRDGAFTPSPDESFEPDLMIVDHEMQAVWQSNNYHVAGRGDRTRVLELNPKHERRSGVVNTKIPEHFNVYKTAILREDDGEGGERVIFARSDGGIVQGRVAERSGVIRDLRVLRKEEKYLNIGSLMRDDEGNLWVGTVDMGVVKMRPRGVRRYVRLPTHTVQLGPDGKKWVYLDGRFNYKGLMRVENAGVEFLRAVDDPYVGMVQAIDFDADGVGWIMTTREVLRSEDRSLVVPVLAIEAEARGRALICLADGGVMYSTDKGLYRLDPGSGRVEELRLPDGSPITLSRSLFQAANGDVWVGLLGGVVHIRDGVATLFPGGEQIPRGDVRVTFEDSAGTIWIGSYGGGLTRCRDGEFVKLTVDDGLVENFFSAIVEDDQRQLWTLGNLGVARMSLDELNARADGEGGRVQPDLVARIEGNSGHPAGVRDGDGLLWFSTIEGLVSVDPRELQYNSVEPPVVIERVWAQGRQHDPEQRVVIPPGARDLEIDYAALTYADPQRVRFKYRLSGYNNDWVVAGNRRTAYFTKVPPGEYRFQVIASNNSSTWNTLGAEVRVWVVPAFYERAWFVYAIVGLCVFLLILLYAWRIRVIRRRALELERVVQDRTHDLLEVNRELESFTYSVSHDLRAPVRHVGGFAQILESEHGPALGEEPRRLIGIIRESAEKMAELIEDLLRLSRLGRQRVRREPLDMDEMVKNIWAELGSQHDTGRAQFVCEPLPVVSADPGLVWHVWQNLLDNALKYSAKAEHPRISVEYFLEHNAVWFRVSDNGAGFDERYADRLFEAFQRLHPESEFAGTGIGLAIVSRVILLHRGKIRASSEVGRGTRFEFTLG